MLESDKRRYQRLATVAERRVADEWVLVPPRADIKTPCRVLALNRTAGILWQALAAPQSLDDLANALERAFEVDRARAIADARIFLERLVAAGAAQEAA